MTEGPTACRAPGPGSPSPSPPEVASPCPLPDGCQVGFMRWGGWRGRAPQAPYRPQPSTVVPQPFSGSNTGQILWTSGDNRAPSPGRGGGEALTGRTRKRGPRAVRPLAVRTRARRRLPRSHTGRTTSSRPRDDAGESGRPWPQRHGPERRARSERRCEHPPRRHSGQSVNSSMVTTPLRRVERPAPAYAGARLVLAVLLAQRALRDPQSRAGDRPREERALARPIGGRSAPLTAGERPLPEREPTGPKGPKRRADEVGSASTPC